MQVRQRRDGYPWGAEPQQRADGLIEHPGWHDGDHAQRDFNVENFAVRPPLAVVPPQSSAVQRMPAIMDDHISPDMGRMSP